MRVSAVGFLNAAPLTWGLRAGRHPPDWSVSFDPPSRCARLLQTGDADVGLVPSIEFGRSKGLVNPVSLGVAARGEVTSVLLLCGGELEAIERVYLDPASRTSQALTRLLLATRTAHQPSYEERENPPSPLGRTEAALIIGDRALALPAGLRGAFRHDLAAMWAEETGLPFVFALWASRPEVGAQAAGRVLRESWEYGRERLEEIATEYSGRLGLPRDTVLAYLEGKLTFELGPEEMRGLALFLSLAGC